MRPTVASFQNPPAKYRRTRSSGTDRRPHLSPTALLTSPTPSPPAQRDQGEPRSVASLGELRYHLSTWHSRNPSPTPRACPLTTGSIPFASAAWCPRRPMPVRSCSTCPPDLQPAFAYEAGQFCTFRVWVDGQPHVRCYSMSSSPAVDNELRVTVKRTPDGVVSNWMNDLLAPGDVLEVARHHRVSSDWARGTGEVVLFSAGSGITPVLSLLKTALATTSRPVRLLYANRDLRRHHLPVRARRPPDPPRRSIHAHPPPRRRPGPPRDPMPSGPSTTATRTASSSCAASGPFNGCRRAHLAYRRCRCRSDPHRAVHPREWACPNRAGRRLVGHPASHHRARRPQGDDPTITPHDDPAGRHGSWAVATVAPASREAGATCMARLLEGTASMHVNNALTEDEVADGWVLTCQAVPTSPLVHVAYGLREGVMEQLTHR